MKLASARAGRDGRLLVISRDLSVAADAGAIAPTLQAALDDWQSAAPRLQALFERIEAGTTETFPYDPRDFAAPLPRAYQWIDGSAYVNHVELMRRSRNEPLPPSFWTEPLLYQGGSDGLSSPTAPIPFGDTDWGADFEAEIAVITDDVPMGVGVDRAGEHIVLYALANDVSLRRLIPAELETGFGFFSGKPATAFAPVVVTPDELVDYVRDDRLDLPMRVDVNGEPFGRARIGADQVFTFAELIARAARTRSLGAGTIVGGGTVSNKLDGGPGRPIRDGGAGFSCIAEQRAVETIVQGRPRTPWLATGDTVTIEVRTPDGKTVFGRIEQPVVDFPATG